MSNSLCEPAGSTSLGAGRYAPSPSGDLHLGNLRTAVLAWLAARDSGRAFRLRVDDLDPGRSRAEAAARQLTDLARLGIDHDGDILYQSAHHDAYAAALARLEKQNLVYECYCSRREVLEAPRAPHSAPGAYPGTCRELSDSVRATRRASLGAGRAPALRLRSDFRAVTVVDQIHGDFTGVVDDLVLRRSDGAWAYNLAVVVDDAAQGVDQVVRGDDLLSSTPAQAYLADLLNIKRPDYMHVPLVLNASGQRLAKRDGAVTLADLAEQGVTSRDVISQIGSSLGVDGISSIQELRGRLDYRSLAGRIWTVGAP